MAIVTWFRMEVALAIRFALFVPIAQTVSTLRTKNIGFRT
jgi:hypothetical protein